jgi:hypothetical protein
MMWEVGAQDKWKHHIENEHYVPIVIRSIPFL